MGIRIVLLAIFINLSPAFALAQSAYTAGECVKHSGDGFIWKISRIDGNEYVAQGFFTRGWENEVEFEFDVLDGNDEHGIPRFHQTKCPSVGFQQQPHSR